MGPPKATQTPEDSHNQPETKKMQTEDWGDNATPSTTQENIQYPKMNSFILVDHNSPDPQQWIKISDSIVLTLTSPYTRLTNPT